MSNRVLVTGANGYIGSHLVVNLLDHGDEVIAADRRFDHVDKRAEKLDIDIFDGLASNLYNVDIVIHLAWLAGFNHGDSRHLELLPKHVKLIEDIVAHGVKRLAIMGSMHEIGYWEGAVDENTPCFPQSYYGIAKDALRNAAFVACRNSDTKLYWLRAYYLTGDDERNNSIFAKLNAAIKEGKDEFPMNSGKNQYDFIDIDEAANQIRLVIGQECHTGIINICSGKPVALSKVVEDYVKKSGSDIRLAYGKYPDRPYDSPIVYGDSSLIEQISIEAEQLTS